MTLSEKLGLVNLANRTATRTRTPGAPPVHPGAHVARQPQRDRQRRHTGHPVTGLARASPPASTPPWRISYGQVLGQEARGKGIDVVQGPELNLDRVPQSGRAFEAYGEDPYLTAAMGVANIEGIQSEDVMADAKHYSAYNQETARYLVNQVISARALAEIYQVPFEAAVQQGHVATIMCSYGSLNGVNSCSSPYLYQALESWGFAGFVRSDLDAVEAPVPAFVAGMSVIKPAAVATLRDSGAAETSGHKPPQRRSPAGPDRDVRFRDGGQPTLRQYQRRRRHRRPRHFRPPGRREFDRAFEEHGGRPTPSSQRRSARWR